MTIFDLDWHYLLIKIETLAVWIPDSFFSAMFKDRYIAVFRFFIIRKITCEDKKLLTWDNGTISCEFELGNRV